MTGPEIVEEVAKTIGPKLQELGVEAFVLSAYVKTDETKVARVVIVSTLGNPAYEDGLGAVVQVANIWSSRPVHSA